MMQYLGFEVRYECIDLRCALRLAAVAVKMQNDFFGESWILDEVAACGVRRRPASNDECGSVHLVKY